MKKHVLRNKLSSVGVLSLVALAFVLSACAGRISGNLYYDTNNNGIQDAHERGAGFIKLTVTHDDKTISEGLTLPDGSFYTKSKGKGVYCIIIDQSSLKEHGSNLGGSLFSVGKGMSLPPAKGFVIEADLTKTDTETDTTTDDDKDGAAADKCVDKDGDGVCDEKQYECPDKDNDGKCDDYEQKIKEDEEKRYRQGEWTNEGYCQTAKRSLSVEIPITIDYAASISDFAPRIEQVCYAGELCKISIPFPDGCELEPLDMPDGITYAGTADNIVEQDEMAVEAKTDTIAIPQVSIDMIDKGTVLLRIDADIVEGDTDVTLHPVAECSGGLYPLQDIPVRLVKDIDVKLYQDLKAIPGQKDQVEIQVTLENNGSINIEGGEILFEEFKDLVDEADVKVQSVDSGCYNLGHGMQCPISVIEAGESVTKKVVVKVLDTEKNYVFAAGFHADDLEKDVEAQKVTFSPE